MSRTKVRGQLGVRQLPATAREAVAEKAAERRVKELARSQFSRTFADVLSGRFGGRWSVEWKRADRSASSPDGNRRTFAGEE
jgi:hypothetical protein